MFLEPLHTFGERIDFNKTKAKKTFSLSVLSELLSGFTDPK